MTAIQFSEFTPDDQEPIRRLILDGLGDHWGDVDESLNADLHDIADSYRAGRTIVGRLNSQTVATGTLIPDTAGVAQIVRMSVQRDLRRTGLGRAVLAELLSTADSWGCDRVILETSTHWDDVAAFYLGCGFRITHRSESEFGPNTWFERKLGPNS